MLTAFLLTGMTAVARDSNTTRPAAVSNDGQRVSLFEETLWAASRAASTTAREGHIAGPETTRGRLVLWEDNLPLICCDPGGILTLDLQNRNLTLYTAKLRSRLSSAKIQLSCERRKGRAFFFSLCSLVCGDGGGAGSAGGCVRHAAQGA